jgi:hypothetical protein
MHDSQFAQLDVQMAELDLRFQILETASYDGTLMWKLRDYARRKQDAVQGRTLSLYSQPFYTHRYGYKMCARVNYGRYLYVLSTIRHLWSVCKQEFSRSARNIILQQTVGCCNLNDVCCSSQQYVDTSTY